MAETESDRTLMALLALDAEDSSGAQPAATPTLGERVELYLRAVYGPDAVVTERMRAAAREHLLAAMAADLAEEKAAEPAHGGATASAGAALSGFVPHVQAALARGLAQLASAAAELFTLRGMRMAAVPLVALLIVGSVWTKDWINEHGAGGSNATTNLPGNTGPTDDGTGTRSLSSPAQSIDPARERELKRAIAEQVAAHGADDPTLAHTLVELGALYREEGRYEAAEGLYKRALAIQRGALGAKDPATERTIEELAAIYRLEGRAKEADDLLHQAAQQ